MTSSMTLPPPLADIVVVVVVVIIVFSAQRVGTRKNVDFPSLSPALGPCITTDANSPYLATRESLDSMIELTGYVSLI